MAAGQYDFLSNHNLIDLLLESYEGSLNRLWSADLANAVDSDREAEDYGSLGAAPSLQEATGDDFLDTGLAKFTYSLRNKAYRNGITLTDLDRRRDRIGRIEVKLGEFGDKAAEHWDAITTTAITTNGNGYDGVAFFSTAHPESGTSQVNAATNSHIPALNVATATTPTADEFALILPQAIGHMHSFTDDKGDPVNGSARKFTLLCGTAPIWGAAHHALTAMNLTSGASNAVQGLLKKGYEIEAVLTPRLASSTDKFWLFRADGRAKPFIHQTEKPLEVLMTDKASDLYIKQQKYIMTLNKSCNVGYGRWAAALQCTLS